MGFQVGVRESAQSWRELLVDLRSRRLSVPPDAAVGDGALGFWKAMEEVFPETRHQRCWTHKVSNVLNKVPKSMHPAVKADLREIWQAEIRAVVETAVDTFAEKYGAKYQKAVTCLTKDREALLTFYDFPPITGIICAPRSRACSPPSGIGPCVPRAPCHRRRQSSWSSR